MVTRQRRISIVILLFVAVIGCGGSGNPISSTIMTDAKHTHYHVHAVDASHEHTHRDDAAFGGHVHSHQHPE